MALSLPMQPAGQCCLVIVQLGGGYAFGVTRLQYLAGQIFADRVARKSGTPGDVPDADTITMMPASNYTQ